MIPEENEAQIAADNEDAGRARKRGPKPRQDRDTVRSALIGVRMSPDELRQLEALALPGEKASTALRRLALK